MNAMLFGGRMNNRWSTWLTVIAALFLISCAATDERPAGAGSSAAATQSPPVASSDTATPADPTAATENSVTRVGVIDRIEGGTVFVQNLDGIISVHLTRDTIVQKFADRTPEDLAIGQRVTVMGRGSEAGVDARAVIVSLDNTSLFQDQGDFQIGRGTRALVGIIESIDDGSITVTTKLGPRVATFMVGAAIQMPTTVSIDELSAGQLVTVVGSENPKGGINARSVLITPELGRLMGAGRTGGRGGRAWFRLVKRTSRNLRTNRHIRREAAIRRL